MKSSVNPEEYIPVLKESLNGYLHVPGARNTLKATYKEYIGKNNKLATCLAFLLCNASSKPNEWYDILKQLPTPTRFYNHSQRDSYYGDCLENVILFPDGRIIIHDIKDVEYDGYDNLSVLRAQTQISSTYCNHGPAFLYNPSGECLLGYLKVKGTGFGTGLKPKSPVYEPNDDYGALNQFKENTQYDLAAGVTINFNTGTTTPYYLGYKTEEAAVSSITKSAAAAEKKKEAQGIASYKSYEAKLKAKYGTKAYNAASSYKPYVGMPSGILKQVALYVTDTQELVYQYTLTDKWANTAGNWEEYKVSMLAAMAHFNSFGTRLTIRCRNGKVVAVYH